MTASFEYRPGESRADMVARMRDHVAPALAPPPRNRDHWRDPYAPEQPKTANGRLLGRPRGDTAILRVLRDDAWLTAQMVADRLGLALGTTYQRLYRAEMRGLVEHAWGRGYRRLKRSKP